LTFISINYSYIYNHWPPSRIVFEAWKAGLKYTGIVDFDTIAGIEETLLAGKVKVYYYREVLPLLLQEILLRNIL